MCPTLDPGGILLQGSVPPIATSPDTSSGSIGIHLDAETIGIRQVEGLAHRVIRRSRRNVESPKM
jgi:hypothetical protein